MEVVRGQDAVLSCATHESTYFQWLKDGTTLTATSNKYRTGGDDKHSTLVIKQFSEFDEGKFCQINHLIFFMMIDFRCLYLCYTRRSIDFDNTSNISRTYTT